MATLRFHGDGRDGSGRVGERLKYVVVAKKGLGMGAREVRKI